MSTVPNLVTETIKATNVFQTTRPLIESATKAAGPYVSQISVWTTENIIRDRALAFYVTLLFCTSLLVIVLSDRLSMTRNVRAFLMSIHFSFIKVLRTITVCGLFFLGMRIGSTTTFADAFTTSEQFIITTTLTYLFQKMIEWIAQVNVLNDYAPTTFTPIVRKDNVLQSILLVIYDYLSTYNFLVSDAMVGRFQREENLESANEGSSYTIADDVSGSSGDSVIARGQVKLLFDSYKAGVGGDFSRVLQVAGNANVWYHSPLYAGVVVGMLSR
jgi:hypothetical protein